jgi:hypothetical protein
VDLSKITQELLCLPDGLLAQSPKNGNL